VVLWAIAVALFHRLAAGDEEAVLALLAAVKLAPADRKVDDRGAVVDERLLGLHGDSSKLSSYMRIPSPPDKFPDPNAEPN
jgi:hypothetical protein